MSATIRHILQLATEIGIHLKTFGATHVRHLSGKRQEIFYLVLVDTLFFYSFALSFTVKS